MVTHRFTPTRFHNAIGTAEAALVIADGDTVITSTLDAAGFDERGKQQGERRRNLVTAARHAAGACVLATDLVMRGEYTAAFCAVRPPGHHATRDAAMGFCLFNNAATVISPMVRSSESAG